MCAPLCTARTVATLGAVRRGVSRRETEIPGPKNVEHTYGIVDDLKYEAAVRLMNNYTVYSTNVPLTIVGDTVKFTCWNVAISAWFETFASHASVAIN